MLISMAGVARICAGLAAASGGEVKLVQLADLHTALPAGFSHVSAGPAAGCTGRGVLRAKRLRTSLCRTGSAAQGWLNTH